jgi:hypothetical protein
MPVPTVRFCRLIPDAPPPQRAGRDAHGTLPVRAARYCDAVTQAAAWGWWLHPPLDFSLLWDGHDIHRTWPGTDRWLPLGAAQFPHFAEGFDRAAPPDLHGAAPPFLAALPEPGLVQVWTGYLARSAPGWSLLVRPPANLPRAGGWETYEGIVEADRWPGPVFANLRLTRTGTPIRLAAATPLVQVQPIPRAAYAEATLAAMEHVPEPAAFLATDWDGFRDTVLRPHDTPGAYALATRRRRRGECPFAAATPAPRPDSAAFG